MVGPWCWTLGALGFSILGSVYLAMLEAPDRSVKEAIVFTMATLYFCPMISVLGAKRPQDGGWHLVVASLWCILVLPAAEALAIHRGGQMQIQDARAWFLWILLAIAWLNYIFTRFVPVATLCCVAMAVWLAPWLPGLRWEIAPTFRSGMAALMLLVAALLVVPCRRWKADLGHPLDEAWIDFRDTYGITWGLRVMERVNGACRHAAVPACLEWDGFHVREPLTREQNDQLQASLMGILRRFVRESE